MLLFRLRWRNVDGRLAWEGADDFTDAENGDDETKQQQTECDSREQRHAYRRPPCETFTTSCSSISSV